MKRQFLCRSWISEGAPDWYQQLPSWIMVGNHTVIFKETGEDFFVRGKGDWLWLSDRPENPFMAFSRPGYLVTPIGRRDWLRQTGWRGWLAIMEDNLGFRWISKILEFRKRKRDLALPLEPQRIGPMIHEGHDSGEALRGDDHSDVGAAEAGNQPRRHQRDHQAGGHSERG